MKISKEIDSFSSGTCERTNVYYSTNFIECIFINNIDKNYSLNFIELNLLDVISLD